MRIAVEFKSLSYCYPDTNNLVLEDVFLKIPQNSFFVIVGPSGCGKTTLLSLARGFYQEWGGNLKGEIFVNGQKINRIPVGKLGRQVGLIFQNPALQLHQLRVIDEVMSAPMYQNLPYQECRSRAEKLVDEILGKEFFNRIPSELSCGEQQKVALAAVLAMKADILLLDEPLSFLDSRADQEIFSLLVKLHHQGKTIIVATHDIEEIASAATHLALLGQGKLIMAGQPAEVLSSRQFEEVMPPPLSVRTAKALAKPKIIGWSNLVKEIRLKKLKVTPKILPQKPILQLNHFNYFYPGTKKGVAGIDLSINQNEVLGIIGANGSGKSTLAKLILGLLRPNAGKISFRQKDITKTPVYERAKNIGFVTQDPLDMFFETNLWDEVAAGPRLLKLSHPKTRAKKILQQLNLWQYHDKHPDSISGGEKSLLGMADILVNDPEILILDEPEFGLDPGNWRKITHIIKGLKARGKTIIVISQDLEILPFLCDRICLMKQGSILKVGSPKEILTDFDLLREANLAPLPIFSLLKQLPQPNFSSEEEFIRVLAESVL